MSGREPRVHVRALINDNRPRRYYLLSAFGAALAPCGCNRKALSLVIARPRTALLVIASQRLRQQLVLRLQKQTTLPPPVLVFFSRRAHELDALNSVCADGSPCRFRWDSLCGVGSPPQLARGRDGVSLYLRGICFAFRTSRHENVGLVGCAMMVDVAWRIAEKQKRHTGKTSRGRRLVAAFARDVSLRTQLQTQETKNKK